MILITPEFSTLYLMQVDEEDGLILVALDRQYLHRLASSCEPQKSANST